jgi:PTS system cellobiose-specific IIA component
MNSILERKPYSKITVLSMAFFMLEFWYLRCYYKCKRYINDLKKGVTDMGKISEEQIVMELVVNGGDARSKAIEAIRFAKVGDFKGAEEKLNACNESLNKAHSFQTQLIQAEAGGEKTEISLIMVHGQDHLMNAMTVRDMAVEMIEMYKQMKSQK